MSSVDLLADYKIIYGYIIGPMITPTNTNLIAEDLTTNQVLEYLNNSMGSDPNNYNSTYISGVKDSLDDLQSLPNGQDDEDEEELDYDEKSKLQLKEETIKRKRRSLKLLQIFLTLIFGGLGLFILFKTFGNFLKYNKNTKKNDNIANTNIYIKNIEEKQAIYYSLIDNICYSLVLFYIVYLISFNFTYYIDLINLEYDNYKRVKNIEITAIHSALTNIKNIVCIMSDTTCNLDKTFMEDNNKKFDLALNIIKFNNNYLKLDKALIDNKLAKEDKIKDINIIFNNYKDIIYKKNNKFDNIIVDNEKQVVCLMNILLYKGINDNVSEDIICSLNNSEGLRGLIEKNKTETTETTETTEQAIFNGFENIEIDDADVLYEIFTGNTLDASNKFELMNNPLFNIILNIFKMKIYKYNIKKHDFIVYIYSHFENMDLKKNGITEINKFDVINNYKTIINIIYSEYETYKKLQITNKNIPIHQINLNKFNEIVEKSTIQNLEDTNQLLLTTKDKLEYFKELHGNQIYNDIKKEQRFNKSLEYLTYLSLFITILQLIKVIYTKKFKNDLIEDVIDVTKYMSFTLLFNSIIMSYWYRKTTNTDYSEMLIKNNDNKFRSELDKLNNNLLDVINIKNLNVDSVELTTLLNKYNINKETNDNNENIYFQNIGDQYIILDERDVKNMVYEDYYVQLTKVIHIHECCSFLTKKNKIPVFPWTDFTVNLIFYIIIFLIIFNVFLINDELNPFKLVNNLKSRLLVNKTDIGKLKNIINTKKISLKLNNNNNNLQGGEYKTEIFKQKNLVNLLVIYLSLLYTYKIYESTFNYNENLFR